MIIVQNHLKKITSCGNRNKRRRKRPNKWLIDGAFPSTATTAKTTNVGGILGRLDGVEAQLGRAAASLSEVPKLVREVTALREDVDRLARRVQAGEQALPK